MRLKYIFLISLVGLLASSCRKDSIIVEEIESTTGPLITVETSLNGLVIDTEGNPIEDAMVVVLSTTK